MSKFKPVEFKVLIKPEPVDEVTKGGLIIPETSRERAQIKQDVGTVIAVGGNAFEDWKDPIPKVGDKVLMSRHAGYYYFDRTDDRNEEYRVVNDKDITMILEG